MADGIDPVEMKKKAAILAKREASLFFSQVKDDYIEEHKRKWSNAKHAFDWNSSLTRYACPALDQKPFCKLQTEDILLVLKPIWSSKHETARKIQNRLKLIFGYAKAGGLYTGDNPAAWEDHLRHYFPVFDGVHKVKHHRSLPYALFIGSQVTILVNSFRVKYGSCHYSQHIIVSTFFRKSASQMSLSIRFNAANLSSVSMTFLKASVLSSSFDNNKSSRFSTPP